MLDLPEHIGLFFIDGITFTFVCGVFFGLKSSTSLPVFERSFIKDDSRLQMPFREPTLTPGLMSILSHVTPLILIWVLCILRTLQREGFNSGLRSAVPTQGLGRIKIPPSILAGLFYTGYFLYGACLMAILVKSIEHMTGELAPNFLSVCKPNYTATEASIIFTKDICTGDKTAVYKASLSFPSQYAAHLSFGFLFNTCIVYCMPNFHKVPMTQHLLMFVMILLPILGGMTRYTEGFNSLGDVFAGLIIGFSTAAYCIFVPLRLFGLNASPLEERILTRHTQQMPSLTFDQLSALPYTDLQVELEDQ